MNQSTQYYFSVEKLQTLINKFSLTESAPSSIHQLKGFVFTPGVDANGNSHIFAYPLFQNIALQRSGDGDLLVQNFDAALMGCPYPPPCQ